MRVTIKIIQNHKQLEDNDALIRNALLQKQMSPYSQIEIPKRLSPIYKKTDMSFRLSSVVNFHVEPNRSKDMMININGYGIVCAEYNPLVENKLEVALNGE